MKKICFHFMIIFVFLCVLILGLSVNSYYEKGEIKNNSSEELLVSKEEKNNIEILQEEYGNSDIIATIEINDSDFKEIVVQSSDNKYYLNHNYKKNYDKLGSIYLDYRINLDNSKKLLIYGHSSSKRSAPFNYLEKYYDEDFYENHKYITINSKNDTYKYEIFSVYVETNDFTYMNLNFDSSKDWYLHLLKLKKKSLYDSDIELNEDDDILILQTCSTNLKYQKYSKKYLLIVSRRVK